MLGLIFRCAFNMDSVYGAIWGSTIMWGVKRGIYSNEAGYGSGAHAAAAAETSHPAKQGLAQSFSVYVDTLFVCTATAIMILSTGAYNVLGADGSYIDYRKSSGRGLRMSVYHQCDQFSISRIWSTVYCCLLFSSLLLPHCCLSHLYNDTNAAFVLRNSSEKTRKTATNAIRLIVTLIIFFRCNQKSGYGMGYCGYRHRHHVLDQLYSSSGTVAKSN